MARHYYEGWPSYVSVAERRRMAEREAAKLRKTGQPLAPVTINGNRIAKTFWGKAWCANLEGYRDYENRLPRGRSYVRSGAVLDLRIAPLKVTALVSGSSLYTVTIGIKAVPPSDWRSICSDCAGSIESLVELLQGRFSKVVMERLCRQDIGLFPKPAEIRFSCSCPDSASMCKHVAAALYGVGSRLDAEPELLFRLRDVDETELAGDLTSVPFAKTEPAAGKVLSDGNLSAMFGLDIVADAEAATEVLAASATGPKAKSRAVARPGKAKATGYDLTPDGFVKWWK